MARTGNDFVDAFRSTHDLLNDLRIERGLADVEKEQVQQVSSDAAPITIEGLGLDDAAQNDSKAYGKYDSAAGIAPGQAVGNVTVQQPSKTSYKVGDQAFDSPDQADMARARRRASVARSYGAPELANRELKSASDLGLDSLTATKRKQDIETGAITQQVDKLNLKKSQRYDQDAEAVQGAEEATRNYIRTNQVDPTTPSGAADIAAHHVAELVKAGRMTEAMKASKEFAEQVTGQLKATKAQREEAATQVQNALQNGGDITAPLRALDGFLPNGGRVVSTLRNSDGSYTINRIESDGSRSVKKATPQQLSQMLDMVTGTDFDKTAQMMIEHRLRQNQIIASTNASNASAAHSGAGTDTTNYVLGQRKLRDAAYAVPEGKRTPEQQALIDGYAEQVLDTKPPKQGNQGMSAPKQNADGSQTMVDRKTDTVWLMPRGSKVWQDVTPGRAPGQKQDPTSMPGGAGAPSPGGSDAGSIPPPAQRVVGQVYRSPTTGKTAKWTGTGWEPVN